MIVVTATQALVLAVMVLAAVVLCARAYLSLRRALDRAEQQLSMIREDVELSEGADGPRVLPPRRDLKVVEDGSRVFARYSRRRR